MENTGDVDTELSAEDVSAGSARNDDAGRRVRRRRRLRRSTTTLVALFVVVAALAAFVWFGLLGSWRPGLRDGEVYGIDVSAHQDRIDWSEVAADNIDFAYIKATEGGDWVDRMFTENWRRAGEVGLERGAYHFFTLCRPGKEQAENFLRIAKPDATALPPAIDLEFAGNCKARPSEPDVRREVDAFVELVEEAWNKQMLFYISDDWERVYPTRERRGVLLWQLRVLRRPTQNRWVVWQIHGFARVNGVGGRVDLNIMRRMPR